MECARGAVKRQRVSTVESALANIDVLSLLATFLEADELCQVQATCKALGSDAPAFDGLSMAEEAARRTFELSASEEEKALLPRHDGEGWIELYHHLLMLRASLTFDQLLGRYIEYKGGDKAAVGTSGALSGYTSSSHSSAICGNHVMRAGKHWATFTECMGWQSVGVIRPLPGWGQRTLCEFHPSNNSSDYLEDLRRERTSRWEGDVHFCHFYFHTGVCFYSNWEGTFRKSNWEGEDNCEPGMKTLGMLLDLDSGALSFYHNGQRFGTPKDGLAGVYCWITCFRGNRGSASIKRGYDVIDE